MSGHLRVTSRKQDAREKEQTTVRTETNQILTTLVNQAKDGKQRMKYVRECRTR